PAYLTTADASNLLLVFPGNDGLGTQSRYPRTFLAKGERVCRRAAMDLQILEAGGRLTWRYVANGSLAGEVNTQPQCCRNRRRGWNVKRAAVRAWGQHHSRMLGRWAANASRSESAS